MSDQRGNAWAGRRSRPRGPLLTPPHSQTTFDQETLALLDRSREVDIQTLRLDGKRLWTRIWVVVVDDQVYVRSVRGDRGHWYQSARERPDEVALRITRDLIPVRAVHATDEESITTASAGLESKYRRNTASLLSMLQASTLETTLRLEPRQAAGR